jgi:dTDP-4-amino-4,6-dideoxygalactose transaminase
MADVRWNVLLSDLQVDEELLAAAREALASKWWSMGPRVAEFEERFAEFCGARHGVAVANGTAALHIALLAIGCGPGDEVILPSLNFVAAANTVSHTGAEPVLCDIHGPHDLNLDPADLERAIGERTKAIVALHYGGYPCDMDAVCEIAERYGLVVIEDAAHAPGATWRGRGCGTIGSLGCFSFFPTKNLPVGEGGMIVTDDDELAARLRLLRSHGMTTLTWDRHRGHAHSYDVVLRGFNYRLDEVHAAVGLVQLDRVPAGNAVRARIAERYRERLDGVAGICVPFDEQPIGTRSAHHLAVVVLPEGVARHEVRSALASFGIQTSVHYPPIHTFTAYAAVAARRPLPQTDRVAERLLSLPLYAQLTEEQVEAVADALLSAVRLAAAA